MSTNTYYRDVFGDGSANHRAALAGDAVNFNGVDHSFLCTTYNELDYTQPFLFFAVGKLTGTKLRNAIFSSADVASGINRRRFMHAILDRKIAFLARHDQGGGASTIFYGEANQTIATPYYTYIVENLGWAEYTYFGDGRRFSPTRSGGAPATVINGANNATVGDEPSTPSPFYRMSGSLKRVQICLGTYTASDLRKAYNIGTMEGIAAPSDFDLNLDPANYDPSTGVWTDISPNGYIFNAQGATNPTKSTFL